MAGSKTQSTALVRPLPPSDKPTLNFAVFVDAVPEMTKWSKEEQNAAQHEIIALVRANMSENYSRLAQGAHLINIRKMFEAKGSRTFVKFLKVYEQVFHVKQRRAYRMMDDYTRAVEKYPEPVLRAAMTRGVNLGSVAKLDQEARKLLGPPPRNPDPEVADRYVATFDQMRRELRSRRKQEFSADDVETNPQVLLHESLAYVHRLYCRINRRSRQDWVEDLMSYIATMAGITSAKTVRPQAIPDGWLRGRGRPRTKKSEEG